MPWLFNKMICLLVPPLLLFSLDLCRVCVYMYVYIYLDALLVTLCDPIDYNNICGIALFSFHMFDFKIKIRQEFHPFCLAFKFGLSSKYFKLM